MNFPRPPLMDDVESGAGRRSRRNMLGTSGDWYGRRLRRHSRLTEKKRRPLSLDDGDLLQKIFGLATDWSGPRIYGGLSSIGKNSVG